LNSAFEAGRLPEIAPLPLDRFANAFAEPIKRLLSRMNVSLSFPTGSSPLTRSRFRQLNKLIAKFPASW
jgi:hypothetical protein